MFWSRLFERIKTKYYDAIIKAQRPPETKSADVPAPDLPDFDLERLRAGRFSAMLRRAGPRRPHAIYAFLRRWLPILAVGRIAVVSRNADVREVLERQDVFETPFGLEMAEMAGGSNFILGMQDGPAYRSMKSVILSAFPPSEVEAAVRPIAARHSREIALRLLPGDDVVGSLLKIVPVRICRDYFGMIVDDEDTFADWSIALSSIFFADPFANATTRQLAVAASRHMGAAIDRSLDAALAGKAPADTPIARLAAIHLADPERLPRADIRSIMMGMIAGFIPTNLLAAGNALDAVLSMPAAQADIEAAIAAGDDRALDDAVLEAMRFKPALPLQFRYVARDAVLAAGTRREKRLKAGTTVMSLMHSAMLDPDGVDDPLEWRPGRPSKDYLVFGHGIHWCIGSAIARAQIGEGFRAIFSRKNVRRARGETGRMRSLGAFPDRLCIDFDAPAESRPVEHSFITIAVPVRPGADIGALRDRVDALGNPPSPPVKAAFDATGIVHFASLSVVGEADPAAENDATAYHLVFEFTAEGDRQAAIESVAREAEPHLRAIFRDGCGLADDENLAAFMIRHSIIVSPALRHASGLCFAGAPGHSVARILGERELDARVTRLLSEIPLSDGLSAPEKLARIRARLIDDGDFDWAFQPAPEALTGASRRWTAILRPVLCHPANIAALLLAVAALGWFFFAAVFGGAGAGVWRNLLAGAASALLGLVTLAALAGAVGWTVYKMLLAREKADPVGGEGITPERFAPITERENHWSHNHLTAVSVMKPGWLRRFTLRLAFFVIRLFAVNVFRPGHLSDIGSIHFARWVLLPGTDKLLFFSNYGGSWESYLEDFITKAHHGLTGVWSNTVGFPRTVGLFREGATDGARFKRWAREQQVPTLFWYSAYPMLTTGRIRAHSQLRQAIAAADTDGWCACIGASEPAPAEIEKEEVQAIFFGGMGSLGEAEMMAVAIPDAASPAQLRVWLEFVLARITFGDNPPADRAMIAAFGPHALARLGLDGENSLRSLPLPFRIGMADRHQSRILGDVGDSAPEFWEWGNGANPADVILVCYAASGEDLKADIAALRRATRKAGLTEARSLPLTIERDDHEKAIEHFGYRDNISQPVIAGTPRARQPADPQHRVAAGEFLHGYPDESGRPALPVVARGRAGESLLAPVEGMEGWVDFSRNGSFLAVRQMRQHVEDFQKYCQAEAARLAGLGADPFFDKDWIGAKMMGRWKDGGSLVRNPKINGAREPDNHFQYASEDPKGQHCPFGAHVRRANPRDTLGPDRATQVRLSKRHRLLRVGRTYVRPAGRGGKAEKGMLFMCLNADIERQFEFVQQTWVMHRSFEALCNERDPFVGNPGGDGAFTIPGPHGPLNLKGLNAFVTVRGGGYFFMPGRGALRYLLARLAEDEA